MFISSRTTRLLVFVGGVFTAIPAAQAATIIVTSDSGGIGGPDCTLRDAITAANTDMPIGGCPAGSGSDVIELPVGATITLTEVDNDTDGPNGLPSVNSVVTINGNGTTVQRDDADGTPGFRIFQVQAGGDLTLDDLTVRGGSALGDFSAGRGGGIYNRGTLTLTNSTISGNTANSGGGGISASGTTTLTNSTVSGNTGSGIRAGGTFTLTNSTVSDNTGSGINNHHGTLTLANSTVSGNTGSGIYNFCQATLTLSNSTVSGNTGDGIKNIADGAHACFASATLISTTVSGNAGHGIRSWADGDGELELTMTNSIVANNTGAADCGNSDGWVYDEGFNIVEDGTCISDPTSFSGDPMLGMLQDNGGPTETHALLADSPAIDEIPSENCEVDSDQRGVPRPQGDGCDIGSYELEFFCLADFDGDGEVGAADLAELLGSWGPYEPCPPFDSADFNDDCAVNAADLAELLGSWGPCP